MSQEIVIGDRHIELTPKQSEMVARALGSYRVIFVQDTENRNGNKEEALVETQVLNDLANAFREQADS